MSLSEAEAPHIRFSKQLSVRVLLGLFGFVFLVIGATYFATQTASQRTLEDQAEKLHREIGQKIILKLGERVTGTEALAKSLAKLGETLPREDDLFLSVVPTMLDVEVESAAEKRLIAGGGIWPEPEMYREGVARRSFFWSRDGAGKLAYFDDYNDGEGSGYHNEEWYVPARYLNPGEVYWSKSYMDPYSFVPMVTCTAPYWRDGKFAGVATVDLRLDGISEFMADQAQHVEGYAFAVDRNNRLISFPDAKMGKKTSIDENGKEVVEYRLVGEVASANSSFGQIAERIENFHRTGGKGRRSSAEGEVNWLATKIASDSYQIDPEEAMRIAGSFVSRRGGEALVQQFRAEDGFFLDQSALISLVSVPSTDWKVLIAMPSEYSDKAVFAVASRVAKVVLVVVSIVCALLYVFLWRNMFAPAKRLRGEVRKLALGGQSGARLEFEGEDELGRIAYWFNKRTDQLNNALNELSRSNVELEEARYAAESASRTKNVFLASMSHEIRTPMNAIIGLSALLGDMEMGKEQANFVGTIRASADSLLSLINDILDFTKIEANELDLEEVPFDLREILEEMSEMISLQAEEKGLGLSCYLDVEAEGLVVGDPGRLRQILLNLASNAIKFTISGRVDIFGSCLEETDTEYVFEFCVKDTGIGIPESAFESLFDSFRQVDSTTTRKYGGTGLGLAICKRLCEKMGGEVTLTSQVGLGSEFRFTVRLGKFESSSDRSGTSGIEPIDYRVFLIDNDWPHSDYLLSELRRQGVACRQFTEVEELEAAIGRAQGGVVVFAGKIHSLSLEQLLKRLTSLDSAHLLGVVSFANSVRTYSLSAEVKKSLVASLEKPFSRSRLLSCVERIGEVRRGEPRLDRTAKFGHDGIFVGYSVLLVEDHPVNQKVASRMLMSMGVDCSIACDGQEAVDFVSRSQKLDAVLMDWQMPVMDGLDATKNIRAMPGWRGRVPIVAMTANAMQGDREKCISAGMNDYLSKPVTPDGLQEVLGRIFQQGR